MSMDFEVDFHDTEIISLGLLATIAEIYQSTFLMQPAPINEVIEKYLSEKMLEEIKAMLIGPKESDKVEEIDNK